MYASMCWLNTNRAWDTTYLLYIHLYIQKAPILAFSDGTL
jgi:hypothetical protein